MNLFADLYAYKNTYICIYLPNFLSNKNLSPNEKILTAIEVYAFSLEQKKQNERKRKKYPPNVFISHHKRH